MSSIDCINFSKVILNQMKKEELCQSIVLMSHLVLFVYLPCFEGLHKDRSQLKSEMNKK